ncbi:hypothetical protein [Hydromonas duriensis]|uniref:Toxic anion resistance protein TelA n=1 Tax=Hydromonas duriensis TaxID=1527608 RepID=A0A4R6Y429_9BURK|nr:hypothetical protein [Hydromonas duriensis]TDR27745.1 hypothetical protein DFR44_1416 [Hydromonas duriensis]
MTQPKIIFGATPQSDSEAVVAIAKTDENSSCVSHVENKNLASDLSKRPKIPFGEPSIIPAKSKAPKILAGGIQRQRISCDISDLKKIDPTAHIAKLLNALQLINSINLDDPYFEDIVYFGAALQKEHGVITETELAVANQSTLSKTQDILTSILKTLTQLNPEQVFLDKKESIVKNLSKLIFLKPSARQVFDKYYPILLEQLECLKTSMALLRQDSLRLKELKSRYQSLPEEIAVHLIAANFIIQYLTQLNQGNLKEHYIAQLNTLDTRTSSLLSTQASVEMALLTNEVLSNNLNCVLATAQALIDEDLPAFYSAYTAALTITQQKTSTTQATLEPLHRIYLNLIQKLQGENNE